MYHDLIKALKDRFFIPHFYEKGTDALEAILKDIPPGSVVGMGGSVTLDQLGLPNKLAHNGCLVFKHSEYPQFDPNKIKKYASRADIYISGCNAITKEGMLVNTDGAGNRLSAVLYGIPKVIFVAGRNKIVNTLGDALQRIKEVAAPLNGKRLGLSTPCALTGKCTDCRSAQRMCRATLIHETATNAAQTHVYIINEDLGY
jgi:hypothetical protein